VTGGRPVFIGVDLAWRDSTAAKPANETGLAVVDADGTVLDAGWARGVDEVTAWVLRWATPGSHVAIDAPVLVPNATGMRPSERLVGRAYGRWHVSANASSASLPWLGGRTLGERLAAAGALYDDGVVPLPADTVSYFECYPYTTLVGAAELGYDERRPRYVARLAALDSAAPPLRLLSHPVSRLLVDEPSPLLDRPYKHREDLLDALVCAWTASMRAQRPERMQVLGAAAEPDPLGRRATLIAPARDTQRLAAPEGTVPVARRPASGTLGR
jgi:predicted RNase H-like nuclease